jgi:uncharacterized damage-inducible protein DinB
MTGRGLLLAELERIARSCCHIARMARPEDYDFAPLQNMRTLFELANHLAQAPLVDLRIMSGAKQEEIRELEENLTRDDAEGWCALLREGFSEVRRYMENLSFDQYENSSCTAFYGRTQTNAQWLLEMVTHLYHHRSQLFTYLKLLGYPVNTKTLYE